MTEATLMACPSLRHASEQPCSDNCAVHYMVKAVNAHDALVSVLEDIEWAGEGRTCPECDRCNGVVDEERGHENCVNTGHRDDCQLAAALEAAK